MSLFFLSPSSVPLLPQLFILLFLSLSCSLALAVLVVCRYLLGRGVKRKLSECDGGGDDSASLGLPYPEQRQLVLDLCLDKLQSCQRRAEPSLHRSVLLANTLRHLQREMRQEGSLATSANPPPPLPPPAPSLHALTPRHAPDLPPVPSDLQPGTALSSDEPDVRTHQLAEEEDDDGAGSGPHTAPLQDSLFGAFEITSSTSCYLSDLPLDDIFEDIDTSMYDASDFSALALAPAQRGNAAGGGGSIGSGDDGLKGFHSSGCTPSSALQFCLSDLNDLDHIMEILVHS